MRVFDLLKTRIEKMEEKRDVKGLILALKDDDELIRQESARALGKISSKEAIEPLTQTLQDPDQGVREEAITALGKIGDPQATPPLIDTLNSQYISIRWRAAQALGKIASKEAIEPLTQTLQDPDQDVREEAITALGRITIKPYIKDLEGGESGFKEEAITALNQAEIPQIITDNPQEPSTSPERVETPISDDEGEQLESQPSPENKANIRSKELDEQLKELKEKGYYGLMEKFVANSKYEYHEGFMPKSRYDYQLSDLGKLKKLLEYKGFTFQNEELQWLIQEEIKKQEYQDFEEKIMEQHPTTKQQYLEQYIKNYTQDTPQNINNLQKLLQKQKITTINLEKQITEFRQQKEVEEFEKKLLQPSMGIISPEKGSPSILLKFLKKDFIEKRDELISKGDYQFIEIFVRMSKYDYQIDDLAKLKKLLEHKGLTFQNEELQWLIQEEIKKQEYQDFQEKIMEQHPTTKQQYLEQYIKNYTQDTPQNINNLQKLLQKQKITTINLEKQITEFRQKKEVEEFEKKLFNEQDSTYESIPVIESNVTKDKALKNAQILYNLGNLFYDLGKPDEALNYYDKAIYKYPDYIEAWKNKGLIFYILGRSHKAAACFDHVLTLDPEYREVWLDIGVIFFEMGKVREAKQCYDKALQTPTTHLNEVSFYTRQFLHKNSFYRGVFDEYLEKMFSDELLDETSDSLSSISNIMRFLSG